MDGDRSTQILDLCEAFRNEVLQPDGSIKMKGFGSADNFRLRQNGLDPHELTLDELRAACVGACWTLLAPGHSTIIDADHFRLWTWLADIVTASGIGQPGGHPPALGDPGASDVRQLFYTTLRALTASTALGPPGQRVEIPHQLTMLIAEGHTISHYLNFPLLEGLLKLHSGGHVDQDGDVLVGFDVPGRQQRKPYVPPPGRPNKVSNLRDLLWFYYERAGPDLQHDVDEMTKFFPPGQHPFDNIYGWRCSTSHGGAISSSTVSGVVLTITQRVLLEHVGTDFPKAHHHALNMAQSTLGARQRGSSGHHMFFYPP